MGIVVLGSTNADLIVRAGRRPAPGETVLGESMDVRSGGKGANQAVAAARHGASVRFIGAVGEDEFADAAQAGLRAAGVDLSGLRTVDAPTGMAVVTVDGLGENSIVVIPGANAAVDAEAVALHARRIAEAEVLVLQGEIPREGIEEAARHCAGRLVLNLAPAVEVSAETLRAADPLVVNEHEAVHAARLLDDDLTGATAAEGAAGPGTLADPVGEGLAAVRRLVAAGVPAVVLTAGAAGAYLARPRQAESETQPREQLQEQPQVTHVQTRAADVDVVKVPAPAVEAVDTTGAGDAFVGALAAALARDEPWEAAVRAGVQAGAESVQTAGAQPTARPGS